ncbi:MAG: hypothetical protein AB7X49_27325, partial [Geminicoccaceae bacterium]
MRENALLAIEQHQQRPPLLIEDGADSIRQALWVEIEARGPVAYERQLRVEADVVDADASPRLETQALPRCGGKLPQHGDAQEPTALACVLEADRLFAGHSPYLGDQASRHLIVGIQRAIQIGDQIADRHRAAPDPLCHQRAQPEAPGVIRHPPGLEGSILAVVGKDQEPPAFGVLDHV